MPHDDVQITILKKMLLKFMECLTCLGLTAFSVLLCLTHSSNLWDPLPQPPDSQQRWSFKLLAQMPDNFETGSPGGRVW